MVSEPFFLDTSGWILLLHRHGDSHELAARTWEELLRMDRPVITSDLVICETGNGLARNPGRAQFIASCKVLRSSPDVRVVSTTRDALDSALTLYAGRPDKTWGLVDCVSFKLMHAEGITDAFTTDHHFEQAGFKCLLPAAGR